jgi:hypothetical protein
MTGKKRKKTKIWYFARVFIVRWEVHPRELPKEYYVWILPGNKGESSSTKIFHGLKRHSASHECFSVKFNVLLYQAVTDRKLGFGRLKKPLPHLLCTQ